MNPLLSPLLISLAIGVGCAVSLRLFVKAVVWAGAVARPQARVPFWIRWCLPFGKLLSPLVQHVLPSQYEKHIRAQLEAMELAPQITPARWIGLRATHAVMGAASFFVLATLAVLPATIVLAMTGFVFGGTLSGLWLQQAMQRRSRYITRELPQYLDLLTVCVEAGSTLTSGVRLIVERAPASPLRSYFETVLREIRAGRPRAQAFVEVARQYGVESLASLAGALAHAESSGMSLGGVLRAQAEQRSSERFARAEKQAMQAPVKMLGPLIFCIFPCTFIVLAVPIAYRLLEAFGK